MLLYLYDIFQYFMVSLYNNLTSWNKCSEVLWWSCVYFQCNILLSGGEDLDNKIGLNYISNSLFDDVSWENRGQRAQHVVDGEEHRQIFTEQYALQRFGAFWVDSLYIYEQVEKPGGMVKSFLVFTSLYLGHNFCMLVGGLFCGKSFNSISF